MTHKDIIFTIVLYGTGLIGLLIWAPWGANFEHVADEHLYYLLLALVVWLLGFRYFGGRFIRPKWKIPGKFIGYMTISFILLIYLGHYALFFILGHQGLGGVGHYFICKHHNIDFWTCEPEAKYLEVTERWARGEFGSSESKK